VISSSSVTVVNSLSSGDACSLMAVVTSVSTVVSTFSVVAEAPSHHHHHHHHHYSFVRSFILLLLYFNANFFCKFMPSSDLATNEVTVVGMLYRVGCGSPPVELPYDEELRPFFARKQPPLFLC